MALSPVDKATFQEVIRLLSQGQDPGQIGRSLDIEVTFLERLLLREDFQQFFAKEKPQAYALWKKVQDEEQANEVVRTMARQAAPRNFKRLQAMVDDQDSDLKPLERANILTTLLKMSGTVQEEAVVETVKISAAHLAALRGAAKEVG